MKKFSEKKTNTLDIQTDTINYISVENLKTYKEITKKYLSKEANDIIDWLIVNNETYLQDLDPEMTADNALEAFYNRGVPKDDSMKELYSCIGKLKTKNRLLEIPVFQTKEQFENIINKKISPDEILLDLNSESGRSDIIQQYTPLIHKIVRQWIGKSNFNTDDLLSIAYEGIVYAMNTFGKRKVRGEDGKWIEGEKNEQTAKFSFMQYAAWCINNIIIENIKNESNLVRIPASQQSKQRKELGYNIKNNSLSGDKTVGKDSEGKGKTLFDYVDNGENGYKDIDSEDLEKLWKTVYNKLGKEFKERDLDIFYSMFGLNDHKKIKGKELAKKYNVAPSLITTIKVKIISFIKKDKELWDIFREILDIVGESKSNKYDEEDQFTEEHKIKINDTINL